MDQKKYYIIKNCTKLSYPDKIYILNIIKINIDNNLISECSDGCRINLDRLPDELINRLYTIVENKFNENSN